MKKFKLLLSVLILCSVAVHGQFHYDIKTTPDSAIVSVNGIVKCATPCVIKYRWRDAINDKIVFEIKSEDYKTWSDTLRKKPRSFDKFLNWDLELDFPIFDLDDNEALISFDKLIADFNDGRIIGKTVDINGNSESIKWSGSIKVGDDVFESKFYEVLTNMGYKSAYTESVKLFAEEQRERPKLPRYTIGVEITDYHINLVESKQKGYYSTTLKGRANVEYTWSVLDKSSGEVVYKKVTNGINRFSQSNYEEIEYNLVTFEPALINFLAEQEFYDLVVGSDDVDVSGITDSNKSDQKLNEIEKMSPSKYLTSSEMIQKASEACVTIITDGGHGSGVVVSKKGAVLTAYHVIEGVNQINVKFSNGLTLKAKLIDYDKFNDIALLDITGEGFRALPLLPKGKSIGLGEELLTIGTPADIDLGQSISKGILSGKRKIENRVYLQTDIAVSPGNSGGPLLNMKGEVVGIVQKKFIGEGIEGIGLSLPMEEIRRIMGLVEKKIID
jgi:small nuclear ribonucleoprotein (snRNP)-like protein